MLVELLFFRLAPRTTARLLGFIRLSDLNARAEPQQSKSTNKLLIYWNARASSRKDPK